MKATVRRAKHYEWVEGSFPREYQESWVYVARHECGWYEELHYWHSAFWAADHHVRYDCGRRSPSGGGYPEITVHKPMYYERMSDERYEEVRADAAALQAFWQRAGMAMDQWLNEGGVRSDPTPSDTGHPLPPEYDEGPTGELGTVATEMGPVPRGLPGIKSGIDGAAWWDRLWGHGRQR